MSIFSRFGKQNRPPKRSIKEKDSQEYPFGETEDVRRIWDLSDKDSYVKRRWQRRLPRFVVPTLIFLVLAALVFWLLPALASRYAAVDGEIEQEVTLPVRMFDDSTRVVTAYAANLLSSDEITSPLITQVLYNEPVTLLPTVCAEGFAHVRTSDGIEGYLTLDVLTDQLDSVEPSMHTYKLVVSDVSKNIMSHASNGTLIMKAMMNTVLYADVRGDGVYQVALPDGRSGWVGSSGVIELGVNETIKKISARYFVSSVLSFVNVTRIEHGLTMKGMSIEGLAYVAASVNGVTLPRTMEEQMAMGERVDPTYDEVTGLLQVTSIAPGDLVFLKDPKDPASAAPYEMAICTDNGSLIMASKSRTSLRIISFMDNEELASRIIAVRRIFS